MRKTRNIKRKLLKKRHTRKNRRSSRRVKLIKGGRWKIENGTCIDDSATPKIAIKIPDEMKEDFSIGQCNGLKLDINQKIDSTKVNATAKAAAAYASKQAAEERKAKLGIHNERY